MRKSSIFIGACSIVALALNVWAYQVRTHPEIMQEIADTRPMLQQSIESGNGEAAEEAAMKLQSLFNEIAPIYEQINLTPAITLANKAAATAGEAAAAARANDLEAAGAAHGMIQKACGGCHGQFREKSPEGSYRIKTGG